MNHRLYSLAKKYIEGSQPANRQRPDKSSPVSNYTMGSVQIVKEIPQRSQECPVCETVYPSNELYCVSKCTHSFCSGCLFGYIKTMIDSNKILDIGCLDSSCDSSGLGDKICAFLNSHNEFLLEFRYRRIRNAGMALKWNKKVCPNEACYAILQDVNEEYRSCNTCKINLCWKCNNLFHDDSPCAVTEAVDFLNCMDKNKIIKCPRCSVNITKAEGCNHMKCAACTNEFCWICRKNYTPDHYSKFNPFGCPGLQFDEPAESSSARCCYKTRAYLFWLFIVVFFPLVYVVFLLSVPTYYYLKRQRNIVKENLKKKANLHKFKEDRGYGTQDQVVVEEYKLRKEHSPSMKVFMCCLWGLAGIPFMLLGLLITVLALPFMPCYFVYKCKSRSRHLKLPSRRTEALGGVCHKSAD